MLPPPTTIATSTPRSATFFICPAIAWIRPASAPYSRSPISASPESFSRMRRNAGVAPSVPPPSRPMARSLFPDGEPREAADHHVLPGLRGRLGAELLDGLRVV